MKLRYIYSLLLEQAAQPPEEDDPFAPVPHSSDASDTAAMRQLFELKHRKEAVDSLVNTITKTARSLAHDHDRHRSGLNYSGVAGNGESWGKYYSYDPGKLSPKALAFIEKHADRLNKLEAESDSLRKQIDKIEKQAKKDKKDLAAAAMGGGKLVSVTQIPRAQIPLKIKIGPQSKGIENPYFAKNADSTHFAGDPRGFAFSAQMKALYLQVGAALKAAGDTLSVIYTDRTGGGANFLATNSKGTFAWRKFGMNNKMYLNGVDINTSHFMSLSSSQQADWFKKHGPL